MQTGIIFVNGQPRAAEVYINKKLRSHKLPHREMHVIPGSYRIRVKKEGYHPWEKNLTVAPRETTFASEIYLWKNAAPEPFAENADSFSAMKNQEIPFHKNVALFVDDITRRNSAPPIAAWNDSLRRWLITTDTEVWLVDSDGIPELLERSSNHLQHTLFLGEIPAIMVQDERAVRIIELDPRDTRNAVTLPIPADARNVAINKSATHIAYTDTVGKWILQIR